MGPICQVDPSWKPFRPSHWRGFRKVPAEICRTQQWQWLKFEAQLEDGRSFTRDLFERWFDEEVGLPAEVPNIAEAARVMHDMIVAKDLVEFLTLPAYDLLNLAEPTPSGVKKCREIAAS